MHWLSTALGYTEVTILRPLGGNLDTHGDGTTVVHQPTCSGFGSKQEGACTKMLGCPSRYAAGPREKGFSTKSRVAYSELSGRTTDWSPPDRSGNRVSSAIVAHYVAFAHGEQKKSAIAPKQAPEMLRPDLQRLLTSTRTRLFMEKHRHHRIALARDIALFAAVFQTGRRGDYLQHT